MPLAYPVADGSATVATMLLVLKLTIAPLLVAAMSLAARRWGPAIGGLIMGLPWMTGPVLFLLTLEKGLVWSAQACVGALLGVIGIAFYVLAYGFTARHAPWPLSVAAAAAAFAAAGSLTSRMEIGLELAALLAAACLVASFVILPRPAAPAGLRALPWWDIPMRMLATAVLVAVITVGADMFGPRLSGIVSTFPVILTVVGSFTHHNGGVAAVTRLLRGLLLSLLSFVVFFWVAGGAIETLGLVNAYLLAGAAALVVSGLLLAFNQIQAKRRSL